MMHQQNSFAGIVLAAAVVLLVGGCGGDGPDLGKVKGTVTLDGNPLPNASVEFAPEGQRGSGAVTDAEGKYELMFTSDKKGAIVGKHTVRITTLQQGGDSSRGDLPESPELVPPKYNKESTLTVEVTSGRNTHDFDLTSQ